MRCPGTSARVFLIPTLVAYSQVAEADAREIVEARHGWGNARRKPFAMARAIKERRPGQAACVIDDTALSRRTLCTSRVDERDDVRAYDGNCVLTEPATPPLPPPMKTMSYLSRPGFVTGGILATALPVDNARVICGIRGELCTARERARTDLEEATGGYGGGGRREAEDDR